MCSTEGLDESPDAVALPDAQRGPALPWSWPEAARSLLAVLAIAAAVGLLAARTGRPRAGAVWEGSAGSLQLDPNTATAEALETLPSIGPTLARRIIEAQADGPFRSPEDLRARVRGIGPATLARIEPYLRFEAGSAIPARSEMPAVAIVDAGTRPGVSAGSSRKPPRSRSRKAKGSSLQLVAKTKTDATASP